MRSLKNMSLIILIAPVSAQGATIYSAQATQGAVGCEVTDSGTGPASALCPNATASSTAGTVGATARSTSARGSDGVLTFSGSASASASYIDFLYFFDGSGNTLSNGSITIPMDFDGLLEFSYSGVGNPFSHTASASAGLNVNGQTESIYTIASVYESLPGAPILSVTGPQSTVRDATFSFDGGFARLQASIGVSARCGTDGRTGGGLPTFCQVDADYGTSLRLLGATVRDASGNILDDVSIVADSGFDYITGAEPHDRGSTVAPVPLPAGLPMLLAALIGTILLSRRSEPAA